MDLRLPFPRLTPSNHAVTSPVAAEYNCIALATGDHDHWWWPDPSGVSYWPHSVPREESIEAFQQAFASLGYEPCDSAIPEPGFEKVAIYASQCLPTHAARQTRDGRWTSKLGELEDIEHDTLELLTGGAYGHVAAVLRRPTSER